MYKRSVCDTEFHIRNCATINKTRLTDRETFVNINHEEIGKTKNASTYNFSVEIYKDLIEFMKYEYKMRIL